MSEAGRFSQDTSVIMATIVEFAQRMLTKRPTVARTSETAIWLVARSPTRARDPRTEITRPKDVTRIKSLIQWMRAEARIVERLCRTRAGETVKLSAGESVKSAAPW